MKNAIILVCLLLLGFLLGMPSPALAFKVPIHEQITREVLADFQVVAGGQQTLKFTDYAIDQIVNLGPPLVDKPLRVCGHSSLPGSMPSAIV